MQAVAVTRIR
ncbi:hypothetical protein YPPY13_1183, partial [Yersinia pestis PY-13]